jgi:hypothetical protein
MLSADDLWAMPRAELREVLCAGHDIDPAKLDDTAYRGTSLGLPVVVERLSWKTFRKTFHRDPASGRLRGWNVRLEQTGVRSASVPLRRRGRPVTFGHYQVTGVGAAGGAVAHGLLLDYRFGAGGPLSITRRVRDPIVAVNAGSAELLLGWTYLELAGVALSTPSYFTLEREGPLDHIEPSPR